MDSVVGTVSYMSPEMLKGKPYSKKADIWSLGIILYEICTFKHPFIENQSLNSFITVQKNI